MVRRLSAEEAALWGRVARSVRPLGGAASAVCVPKAIVTPFAPAASAKVKIAPPKPPSRHPGPGSTLDATWDRRLSRGMVQPDLSVDLHGHNLATAYDLLDRKLEQAIAAESRLLLLITGKPPSAATGRRGAIRAAVDDWLAASRHAGQIAAVRNAHPRHGGSGALHIVLRRVRPKPSG